METRNFLSIFVLSLLFWAPAVGQSPADDHLVASKEQVVFYTSAWEGERMPDGRPDVSEALLGRLKNIRIEDAENSLPASECKTACTARDKLIQGDQGNRAGFFTVAQGKSS